MFRQLVFNKNNFLRQNIWPDNELDMNGGINPRRDPVICHYTYCHDNLLLYIIPER